MATAAVRRALAGESSEHECVVAPGVGRPGGVSRRAVASGLGGLGAAAALAACQPGAGPAAPPAAELPEVTLDFWSRFSFLEGAADTFNQTVGPQRRLRLQFAVVPDLQDKLLVAISGGTPPDVASIDLIFGPLFNPMGGFADVSGVFRQLKYRDQLSKAMLRLGEHGGKQYQLPLAADISAVYLNRVLFAETGLDAQKAPETWAAYAEQARKLVRPPERWGSYLGGSYAFTFLPWVWANGGDLFNADGTRCVFDSPPAVEALQLWVDLNQKWQVSPEENRTGAAHNATEMFTGGRVAMWMAGNTALPTYRRAAPGLDFGTALIPRPTAAGKHGAYAGGDTIGLLAGARHVDRAAELLAYVTGEAVQIDYLAREGYIPIRRDLYDNAYARQEPRLLAFTRALDVARTVYSAKWSVVRRPDGPWQTNLDAAMRGQKTPKQAAGDLQREVNAILSAS